MVDHNLNEYFLGSHLKSQPGHSSYYYIRPITAVHMDNIADALKQLGGFDSYCSLYEICEKNYQSIISYHSIIKDDFPTNRDRSHEYMREAFQEITRLLLNYLASFRAFIDHLGTKYERLKRRGYSLDADFKKITAACYDNSFSYRFFYNLRHYIQHCGIPIGGGIIDEQLNRNGNIDISVSTLLNRDSLLSSFNWKKLKADLKNQPEYMELLSYLDEFQLQIQQINSLVADFEILLAAVSWRVVWELINEVQTQYPDGVPFIGQHKKTDGGEPRFLITYFPVHTMLKFVEKSRTSNTLVNSDAEPILRKLRLNAEKNYIGIGDTWNISQADEKPL